MKDEYDLSKMKSRKNPYITKLKQQVALRGSAVSSEPNGAAMVRIMDKMAARGAFSEIEDPSEWQRMIRKDRPLPFREE